MFCGLASDANHATSPRKRADIAQRLLGLRCKAKQDPDDWTYGEWERAFDNCFENGDGDAVFEILVLRAVESESLYADAKDYGMKKFIDEVDEARRRRAATPPIAASLFVDQSTADGPP